MIKIFILLSLFLSGSTMHPIHVAVSDLVYNSQSKSIEITHKIFIDDIEKHIEQMSKNRSEEIFLKLNTAKENPKADEYLKSYLEKHFAVKISGKLYQSQYIGKEYEADAVWIYAEISKLKTPKDIEITNTILMDFHDDQDNLLHIKVENERKSLRFNKREKTGIIKF